MQISALKGNAGKVESDLKSTIVEPKLSIRRMHTMPYEVPNYVNIIIPGNKDDVMSISPTDRRYNVCPYQEDKLVISDEQLKAIEDELEDFADYLLTYKASRARARQAMDNTAKNRMVHISSMGMEEVCREIRTGNLAFFWEQCPAMSMYGNNTAADVAAGKYMALLKEIAKGNRGLLIREEIQNLLSYTLGNVPSGPYKFASVLKHHKIFLNSHRRDGKVCRAIEVDWKIPENLKKEILE
jgi:hypothetical protein